MDLGPTNGLLASPRNDRRFLRKRASSTRFVLAEESNHDDDDENEPLVELVGEDGKGISDKNRSSCSNRRKPSCFISFDWRRLFRGSIC